MTKFSFLTLMTTSYSVSHGLLVHFHIMLNNCIECHHCKEKTGDEVLEQNGFYGMIYLIVVQYDKTLDHADEIDYTLDHNVGLEELNERNKRSGQCCSSKHLF